MSKPTIVPKVAYALDPIYTGIRTRFRTRHGIDLAAHIEEVTWLGRRVEQGFTFIPWDAGAFEAALKRAGFENDKREKHLGFIPSVGTIAALATKGEGYREPGSPSLHCAVAPGVCSVHLDNVGFRVEGYGPDAGQHIVDELVWQDKIVPLIGRVMPNFVTDFLHRFHPKVPSTRTVVPFSEIGVEFDVASGRSRDLQRHWRVTVDLTHSCADSTCGVWRKLNGKSVQGDNRLTVWFKVVGM